MLGMSPVDIHKISLFRIVSNDFIWLICLSLPTFYYRLKPKVAGRTCENVTEGLCYFLNGLADCPNAHFPHWFEMTLLLYAKFH